MTPQWVKIRKMLSIGRKIFSNGGKMLSIFLKKTKKKPAFFYNAGLSDGY
jgi:hypothetical protein